MGANKFHWVLAAGLLLGASGCASTPSPGHLVDRWAFGGFLEDSHARKSNESAYRSDVKACGHGAAAEWCRLGADDRNLARMFPIRRDRGMADPKGFYVYDESLCAGDMVRARCQGVAVARPVGAPICHGLMIDGSCTGPTF